MEIKKSPKSNLTKRPKTSLSGPKRKVPFTTLFSASPGQAASRKNKKLSFTWITSLTTAPCPHREIATSTHPICSKVKATDPAFLQEAWERHATPEHTQSGTSSRIFSSEHETKHFTSLRYWSLTTDMPLTTRHSSEHVKAFSAKTLRNCWRNLAMKTAVQWWRWDSNKSFSSFQSKPTSKELTSAQQAAP